MANKKGIRRAVGANAAQWSRPWGTCEWPGGCSSPAGYRNQLWNMRLVETCERHTPRRIATAATRSEARAVGCRIITVAKKAAGVPVDWTGGLFAHPS
jgi:hypothetical protein